MQSASELLLVLVIVLVLSHVTERSEMTGSVDSARQQPHLEEKPNVEVGEQL
jgi:hypothetical protein